MRQTVAAAVCTACLLLPMSVAANQEILSKKGLYELRTLTGQFKPGYNDGTSKTGSLYTPTALVELGDGSILISDTDNHRIRVHHNDQLNSYSGLVLDFDEQGFPIGAYADGNHDSAFYNEPAGLAVDKQGNVYVADSSNHSIRKLTPSGEVITIAGNGLAGDADGVKQEARFYYPSDVAVDEQGNVYVADTLNHVIKKIDSSGKVTTLNKRSERVVEYYSGVVEEAGDFKDGKLSEALFNEPTGLAIDEHGNLYVSDTGNQRIRYIDLTAQTVTTVAGSGQYEAQALYVAGDYMDGEATEARFYGPTGLTVARDGSVLIADRFNHAIRILAEGKISTLAGTDAEHGKADGILAAAELNEPTDVIELHNGQLAIADSSNNKVRIISRYQAPEHIEDGHIHVIINGDLLETDVPPQISKGATFVPLRALADHLGYDVKYNSKEKSVSLVINDKLSYQFAGNGAAVKLLAGEESIMDASSMIYQDRLLVPVRFVTEELGFDVQWDGENKHAVIRTPIFDEL